MSVNFIFVNGDNRHEDVINLNNSNAAAILQMLGLIESPNDLWEIFFFPLEEVKQAILVAEGLFDVNAPLHTREHVEEGNYISFGLDQQGLQSRLERLKTVLLAAEERGMAEMALV